MTWISNKPGERPLVLVGAGFPLAVLDFTTAPPSTANILEVTANNCPNVFPIIKRLINLTPNRSLNYVWTHINEFAIALLPYYEEILSSYSNTKYSNNSRIRYLLNYLIPIYPPLSFLNNMLGIELKKAIAFNYNTNLSPEINDSNDLEENLIMSSQVTQVTWISLNYDVTLEYLIDKITNRNWYYWFKELITVPSPHHGTSKHVIVKPHGSVNVWFKTVWNAWGKPLTHSLEFADEQKLLRTCHSYDIGCEKPSKDTYEEYRPWIVGYLPDFMKDEHNTPGNFADCAHDLCKANLTYAALSLYHATSVYILGYSMPSEDQWIWNRFAALPQKDFPVYVASKDDSERIVQRFRNMGFSKVDKLNDEAKI